MALNIAVCIKAVPDSKHYDKISIDPATRMMVREGIPMVISDLDKHALEAALVLRDKNQGKVSVFMMAIESAKENLLEALAMGADEGFLLSDRAFAGADTLATSYTLATAIKAQGSFDIVFTGNESDDGSTGQVSAQLGEWLCFPHIMNISALSYVDENLNVTALTEDGFIEYNVMLPVVLGVTRKVNKPRLANIMGLLKAKSKPLTILHYGDFPTENKYLGLKGSPTQPGDIYTPQMSRKTVELSGTPDEIAARIVQELCKAGVKR